MKTSGFVAIVVLIASTRANVEEFSEDAIANKDLYDPYTPDLEAGVINANIGLELEKRERTPEDDSNLGILLKTISIPHQEFAFDDPNCNQFHGITINGETYCRIKEFKILVSLIQRGLNFSTRIYFIIIIKDESQEDSRKLVLECQVFRKPSAYAPSRTTQQELTAWARNTAKVGLSSPFTRGQLETMLRAPITIRNFEWLNEVLTHKVRRSVLNDLPERTQDAFYLRPLVLPDDIIDKILDVSDCLTSRFWAERYPGVYRSNGHVSYTAD